MHITKQAMVPKTFCSWCLSWCKKPRYASAYTVNVNATPSTKS
jgi:hypothetical protein